MSELVAIEYEFGDPVVRIRRCPEFISCIGNKPAYWYLHRPILTMDAPGIGWPREVCRVLKDKGFNVAYWSGEAWATRTPKQFATAQEALDEWDAKIDRAERKVR